MAHLVLDLSLPPPSSSSFSFVLSLPHANPCFAPRAALILSQSCPIHFTASFVASISLRSSTRIRLAFRDHEGGGASHNAALPHDNIAADMRGMCMHRVLRALKYISAAERDIYNILLSKLPQNASRTYSHLDIAV